MFRAITLVTLVFCLSGESSLRAEEIDLTRAVIVIRKGDLPAAEKIAPTILIEEIARRTGLKWHVTTEWPAQAQAVIAISTISEPPEWQPAIAPTLVRVPNRPEAFAISVIPAARDQPTTIVVTGHDSRGAMFGVGKLLRNLVWNTGRVSLPAGFSASEAPDLPLRGHQIGYRDTANSWDAWTYDQFDQYFREMVIFGANAVENIPWQEDKPCPLMKYSRAEMNLKFAELCEKYDLQHWIWVPVLIKLPNEAQEVAVLKQQEEYFRQIKRLDAIFVPGGDPGDNKANVLLPHLERLAALVTKSHPHVKIWLSLQHFKPDDIDHLYQYLDQEQPRWFGGLVMGPSGPLMEPTRLRLPRQYQLRWYPDITHTVRCQYPVPWLDPALGMTLGRESVNPRPVDFTQIYRMDYRFTDGFLTYSDGVHDDFNKSLWSQLGWNPRLSSRDIAIEYARFFFHPDVAELGADGLFSLESNLRGSLADNGSVVATALLWKQLEQRAGTPGSPWRFHLHLFRACYDHYTRVRLLRETDLERQTLEKLGEAGQAGIPSTLAAARQILLRAITPVDAGPLAKLTGLADDLFREIGLQTSVPKYHASNYERGAVLDFIDYPLNNRWWLEDQFDAIAQLTDPDEQLRRIDIVRNWENPGQGGYYDVVGHVGRSPRVVKLLFAGDAMRHDDDLPTPTQRWMREGRNGLRQAWHTYLDSFPAGVTYNDLDSSANYVVRLFAQRASPLMINGIKATLIRQGETFDRVTEQVFDVPAATIKDGRMTLTWETLDEKLLNWRDRHYVTDIWVMKQPAK
jgi:hypothetical protein